MGSDQRTKLIVFGNETLGQRNIRAGLYANSEKSCGGSLSHSVIDGNALGQF
jgi:hypothetical protein